MFRQQLECFMHFTFWMWCLSAWWVLCLQCLGEWLFFNFIFFLWISSSLLSFSQCMSVFVDEVVWYLGCCEFCFMYYNDVCVVSDLCICCWCCWCLVVVYICFCLFCLLLRIIYCLLLVCVGVVCIGIMLRFSTCTLSLIFTCTIIVHTRHRFDSTSPTRLSSTCVSRLAGNCDW